uniref:U6 snRNA-associated Sm-like protein LSm8 n=1 Tax=Falco tinnunculus TaxID=100819 RepID=A0A8C4UEZ7_FALTI
AALQGWPRAPLPQPRCEAFPSQRCGAAAARPPACPPRTARLPEPREGYAAPRPARGTLPSGSEALQASRLGTDTTLPLPAKRSLTGRAPPPRRRRRRRRRGLLRENGEPPRASCPRPPNGWCHVPRRGHRDPPLRTSTWYSPPASASCRPPSRACAAARARFERRPGAVPRVRSGWSGAPCRVSALCACAPGRRQPARPDPAAAVSREVVAGAGVRRSAGAVAMTSALENYINRTVAVITSDGRMIVGTLKGFDQTINLILDESHERVFSSSQGVEQVVLGLYIVRGDNVKKKKETTAK